MSSLVALAFAFAVVAAFIRWTRRQPESEMTYREMLDQERAERELTYSSKYRVERLGATGEGITRTVRYAIWRGSEHVADFAHDFRLDENWFEIGGKTLDYNGGDLAVTWERNGPVYLTLDGEARLERLIGVGV